MTREEAIICLQGLLDNPLINKGSYLAQAIEMAIKALEQEPCDDVVSRQAVLKIIDGWYEQNRDTENIEDLIVLITYMDSVRPQEQTGHWIGIDEEPHEDYECDKCGYVVSTYTANIEPHTEYKYCPNCGARMVEPQESEKVNCKSTKCDNCINHNYCDFEPQESEVSE